MSTITALYVEDTKSDRRAFSGLIKDALRSLPGSPDARLTAVDSADDAREMVETGARYHFYFVDLDFSSQKSRPKLQGLHFVESMRRKDPEAAILVISSMDPDSLKRAVDVGADDALSKDDLFNDPHAVQTIRAACLSALEKHGRDDLSTGGLLLDYDRFDLPLAAAVDHISPGTLKSLLLRIDPKMLKATPTLVSGGLSGPQLFALRCQSQPESGRPANAERHLLLKLQRDLDALQREAEGSRRVSELPNFPARLVLPLDARLAPEELHHRGWYALVARYQSDVVTLQKWLSGTPNPDDLHRLCGHLFIAGGLKQLYGVTEPRNKRTVDGYREALLPLGRRARILLAMEELKPLLSEIPELQRLGGSVDNPQVTLDFQAELIGNFLEQGAISGLNPIDLEGVTHFCPSHGDLHSRNVLVSRDDFGNIQSYLINFAHHAPLPRGADLARLVVDLFITVLNAGPRAHQWRLVPDWLAWCYQFLLGDEHALNTLIKSPDPTWDQSTINGLQLLSWIRGRREEIVPGMPAWELSLAMAIEFLRYSYLDTLPTPKRLLGLAAGSLALQACAHQFNNSSL